MFKNVRLVLLCLIAALGTTPGARAASICTSAADNKLSTLIAFGTCDIGNFEVTFNTLGLSGNPGNNGSTINATQALIQSGTKVIWTSVGSSTL